MAMPADKLEQDNAFLSGLIADAAKPAPSAPRTTVRPRAIKEPTMLEQITPPWARELAEWIHTQTDRMWRVAAILIALFILVPVGIGFAVSNGYINILGVQQVASEAKFYTIPAGIPSWQWWLIPLALFGIQAIVRHIPRLKWLWRPATVYDGATGGIAGCLAVLTVLAQYGHSMPNLIVLAVIMSALGLWFAVISERVCVGAFYVLIYLIKHR